MITHRGYFAIAVVGAKTEVNVGTLWRSAYNFGAAFLVVIGPRYLARYSQASDTMKAREKLPYFICEIWEDFLKMRPYNCPLIAIEQTEKSRQLEKYNHPERAIYILGAEDTGVPKYVLDTCDQILKINTPTCLNVAVAGSIVCYDRQMKQLRKA